MISAVERASIVANAETGTLSFTYDPKTGDVSISAANDAGSAADLVATQKGSKGAAFTVALASRFILDALRHVESESVSIGLNDIRMILVSPVGSTLHRQMVASIQIKAAKPA
jgi:DNA polymerase III sliding clamp (beta) subunit (PCNA family)